MKTEEMAEALGYMTYYTLVVDDEKYAVPEARRDKLLDWPRRTEIFRHEFENIHKRGMRRYTKWCEYDRDMVRLSEGVPQI